MVYLLLKFKDNWADECNFYLNSAHKLTTEDYIEFCKALKYIQDYPYEMSYCFGSNEDNYYENGKDFLSHLSGTLITESEYNTIKELGLGTPDVDWYYYILEEKENCKEYIKYHKEEENEEI